MKPTINTDVEKASDTEVSLTTTIVSTRTVPLKSLKAQLVQQQSVLADIQARISALNTQIKQANDLGVADAVEVSLSINP